MGKCRKCGCKDFSQNYFSAVQKAVSGLSFDYKFLKWGTLPAQDNKSDQVAYRNCYCGHHKNYH